ncbi:MAG: hypothetical protein JO288_11150 [Hyphomicrobiales bacterium]|nr:hypothetical protein [Hyphomicrobiales bacterium]
MILTKLACALLLTGGLALPAFAAQGDAGSGPTTGATSTNDAGSGPTPGASALQQKEGQTGGGQNAANGGMGQMRISDRMRDDLKKAGFTDIKIMPESFLVRAKDPQGNPVMMVINPDSVTAVTEQMQGTNSASNANRGSTSNSAGATPGPGSTGGSQPVTPGGASKP